MSIEFVKTLIFFITGGFLIFLAITITRDNITNRLNRTCGAMLFFAGIGPLFMAFGSILDPQQIQIANFEDSILFNLHYIWEFFFPLFLLFSWIFPEDRLKSFKSIRLRYLIFLPQVMHMVIILFGFRLIQFLNSFQVSSGSEGFTSIIVKPFAVGMEYIALLISFIQTYHGMIFGLINLVFGIATIYFLESGKKLVTNPRILTQTKVINWAARLSITCYIIAILGSTLFPESISDTPKAILIILALLSGTSIFIYATLRYQFLDVRLVFRQSFVYSITSALFVGLYIFIVIQSKELLQPIFGEQTNVINYVIIGFLLLLFQPINNWIDEFTRSFFIRTRTDHRNVIERFSRQVISLFDPAKLRQIIEETLKTTLLVEDIFFVLYDDSVGEYVLRQDRFSQSRKIIKREDLLLRGINQLDSPTFFHSLSDFKKDSELADELERRGVKLILPMKDSEHLLGFLALSAKAAGYNYSTEDINLLGVLSNQMVTALTNARLYVDSLERIRLQEEVSMARQIQLDLLPTAPPKYDCMNISAHSTPSRTVGGDFYDFIKKDDGRLGICIADASGKGMPAALMIAQTQAILKSEVHNGNPIDVILRNMNQQLVNSSSSEKYVTLFYGEFDIQTGWFEFANAGHNYPIIVRQDCSVEFLKTGGPIVGALPMMNYTSEKVKLQKDDVMFFFTDGLSEAMNDREEEYTEERIQAFVSEHKSKEPGDIIDLILKDVRKHDPTYPPRDDTTIISLKINNGFELHER